MRDRSHTPSPSNQNKVSYDYVAKLYHSSSTELKLRLDSSQMLQVPSSSRLADPVPQPCNECGCCRCFACAAPAAVAS